MEMALNKYFFHVVKQDQKEKEKISLRYIFLKFIVPNCL